MPNVFNVSEVLEMGIAKEKKRRDFYGFVAKKFKDRAMRGLFTSLKGWEEIHIKKFTDIKKDMADQEIVESYQGEFSSYIKALVDDMLYKQITPAWFAKNVREPIAAIKYGIGFEKDAILFFSALLKYMEPSYKEKVQLLIDEEKKHIIYLTELKRKYG